MKIALLAAVLLLGGPATAAELKVLATGSMAAPLRAIAADFARTTGHSVDVTVGITTTVTATLQAGDTPDLIEVTSFGMDQLQRENFIMDGSRVEIARAVIGLAMREGAARPGIATRDALVHTLEKARSIAYVNPKFAGQVGVNMAEFFARLGIADAIAKKAVLAFTGEEAVQKVAKGEADIAVSFVSEILPVRGVTWLGPLPAALQVPTHYSAAIGAKSGHPQIARALLEAVRSADGRRHISDAGLEPAE